MLRRDWRRLEENAVKRRLEGAPDGFPDPKSEADFILPRAMHFHLITPALREHRANRAGGEFGGVAIPAEVTEHHAFEFPGKQLFDDCRGGGVREMTVARLNALLHGPRTMRIVLQKFFVMIRLDHEGMDLTQALDHHLRRVTEIGNKPERARAGVKRVSDRIDRIVRNGKGLNGDIADRKIRPGPKKPPVPMSGQCSATDRFGRERVAINRDMKFPAEHFETADMIAVLVGEKHAIELVGSDPALREAQDELARAQAAIDEQPAMIGRDERAVPGAPAPEHRQSEHVGLVADALAILKQNCLSAAENRHPRFALALRPVRLHRPRMKPFVLSLLIGAIALFQTATARADEASHRKAAESLFGSMEMETLVSQSVDEMLAMQVQQNPALAPYQAQMKAFLNKYMSWASLKDDMTKIYTAEFSESELNELGNFYKTPLGKKAVKKMPALMAKGAEIGQKRVQEHLPELEAVFAPDQKKAP